MLGSGDEPVTPNQTNTRDTTGQLPRTLGVVSTAALLVGITIGSGIFRVPSIVAGELGSVSGITLVWLAGAAISLAGALTLVGLVSALPRTGGAYVYIREGFGPLAAFLYGWIKLIVTGPAAVAAVALIFAEYARAFTPLSDRQVQVVAGALLVTLTVANIRSVHWSAWLQNASTITKVIALAALAVLIFGLGNSAHGTFAQPVAWGGFTAGGFWTALISVLWTYTGWVDFTYVAGEVRDPSTTYPRALLAGMAIVVFVYLAINAAYLYVLPLPAMATSTLVAATAAERAIGTHAATFVALLVMISTFGSLNGSILTSPRVYFALADDGLFFRIWPFYALSVAAVFLMPRRRPELAPLCRGWGYPVLPIAFLIVSVAMLANGLVHRPFETALSLGIVLVGVPVYYAWQAMKTRGALARAAVVDSSER